MLHPLHPRLFSTFLFFAQTFATGCIDEDPEAPDAGVLADASSDTSPDTSPDTSSDTGVGIGDGRVTVATPSSVATRLVAEPVGAI